MRAWSVAAVAVALFALGGACSRGGGSAQPTTTAMPSKPVAKAPACVADGLGALDSSKLYADCNGREDECRAACERDDVEACFGLALVVQQAALAMKDPNDAKESHSEVESNRLYAKACLLGAPNACTNHAAHLWRFSEQPSDLSCAQRIFERTCEHDDHFGCGMAGRLLLDHAEGPEDEDVARGRAILERSCIQIGGFPCRILALNYEYGRLGEIPEGRLEALMQQACNGGDDDACGEHTTVEETFRHR